METGVKTMGKSKIYVGYTDNGCSQVFKSEQTPTERSHGHVYLYSVGPFKTMRAAMLCRDYGKGNPHMIHVDDIEKLARANNMKPLSDDPDYIHNPAL